MTCAEGTNLRLVEGQGKGEAVKLLTHHWTLHEPHTVTAAGLGWATAPTYRVLAGEADQLTGEQALQGAGLRPGHRRNSSWSSQRNVLVAGTLPTHCYEVCFIHDHMTTPALV